MWVSYADSCWQVCIGQNPHQLLDVCNSGCFVTLKRTVDKYRKRETLQKQGILSKRQEFYKSSKTTLYGLL